MSDVCPCCRTAPIPPSVWRHCSPNGVAVLPPHSIARPTNVLGCRFIVRSCCSKSMGRADQTAGVAATPPVGVLSLRRGGCHRNITAALLSSRVQPSPLSAASCSTRLPSARAQSAGRSRLPCPCGTGRFASTLCRRR